MKYSPDILEYVTTHNLIRKDGIINAAVLRQPWFKASNIANRIFEETSWLHPSVEIVHRIKFMQSNITLSDMPHCPVCGNKINDLYKNEIRKYCNISCAAKTDERQAKLKASKQSNTNKMLEYNIKAELSIDQLKEIIKKKHFRIEWDRFLIRNKIFHQFMEYKRYDDDSYPEIAYRILNDMTERPNCKCGKMVTFGKSTEDGYHDFCSVSCKFRLALAQSTCMEKYGVYSPFDSDEFRQKSRATKLERYGDEYYTNKEKGKETTKLRWGVECTFSHPDFIEAYKIRQANYNSTKRLEIQKRRIASCISRWGVSNYAQTGLPCGYKWKPYTLPSGNIIMIQGYENLLLDELLSNYSEEQILTSRTDMPAFWYYTLDGVKHRYFPDAYVPSTNTIYEVKSEYTYSESCKNDIFQLKKQSVIDAGFNFVLKIYDI